MLFEGRVWVKLCPGFRGTHGILDTASYLLDLSATTGGGSGGGMMRIPGPSLRAGSWPSCLRGASPTSCVYVLTVDCPLFPWPEASSGSVGAIAAHRLVEVDRHVLHRGAHEVWGRLRERPALDPSAAATSAHAKADAGEGTGGSFPDGDGFRRSWGEIVAPPTPSHGIDDDDDAKSVEGNAEPTASIATDVSTAAAVVPAVDTIDADEAPTAVSADAVAAVSSDAVAAVTPAKRAPFAAAERWVCLSAVCSTASVGGGGSSSPWSTAAPTVGCVSRVLDVPLGEPWCFRNLFDKNEGRLPVRRTPELDAEVIEFLPPHISVQVITYLLSAACVCEGEGCRIETPV
jgi:hypothetical protein